MGLGRASRTWGKRGLHIASIASRNSEIVIGRTTLLKAGVMTPIPSRFGQILSGPNGVDARAVFGYGCGDLH